MVLQGRVLRQLEEEEGVVCRAAVHEPGSHRGLMKPRQDMGVALAAPGILY